MLLVVAALVIVGGGATWWFGFRDSGEPASAPATPSPTATEPASGQPTPVPEVIPLQDPASAPPGPTTPLATGIDPAGLAAPRFDRTDADPGPARLVDDGGSRLRIESDGPAGFVVVSDCLVPGWSATVDGADAPLLRADYAFRAVPVPAGRHVVVLRYAPW